MNENKQFPTYQYSVFLGSRDEQLVIRTDTFEELIEAKKNVDVIIRKREATPLEQAQAASPVPPIGTTVVCQVCGAPGEKRSGLKKNKQMWHAIFCSTGDRNHTKFL